jgi:Spy/CpxP family protein refolding chaperone
MQTAALAVAILNERGIIMKRQSIVCAVLTLALAGGSYSAGEVAAGDSARVGVVAGKKMQGEGGSAEEMHKDEFLTAMARVLRLNDSQQSRIREMLKADREENARLDKELAENLKLIREKTGAAIFDEAGVRTLAEKQGRLMARTIIAPAVMRQRIRALLTPEQREVEERIQPLLVHGPGHRPHPGGAEPPRGMEKRSHFQEYRNLPGMGNAAGETHPCCDED